MRTLIVAGGTIEPSFAEAFLDKMQFDSIIGVDRGAKFLHEKDLRPDILVGDFDSLEPEILRIYEEKQIPIRKFQPQKDSSDMELGIQTALETNCDEIYILGGTGTRLDHVYSNIQTLAIAERAGVKAMMVDSHNRIRLLLQSHTIKRDEQYGKYLSLFPLTTIVTGVYLEGFAYPLHNDILTSEDSIGLSNEIIDEVAQIRFTDGVLIMIESND